VSEPKRLGLKADQGWGKYFIQRQNAIYILTFEVLDVESASPGTARLLLKGGGLTYQ
jgi:hypothetical protein